METKFWEFLNEISFNLNHTTYEINYHIFNKLDVESYDFFSKNKNKYSVYFLITTEGDEKLSNGHKLSDYTKLNEIPTIFFSLSEKGFGNEFDNLTNKNEYLDVMGKVAYLILEYINKHNYSVFSIGEVSNKKMNFYNNYRKYFKKYSMLTALSSFYKNKNDEKTYATFMVKWINDVKVDRLKLDENCYLKF